MRFSNVTPFALSVCFALTTLCGCNGSTLNGLSPSVGQSSGALSSVKGSSAVKRVAIAGDSCCALAVDRQIGKIYVSSNVNLSGNNTTVVAGKTLSVVATVAGFGGANNADEKSHNVWLAGLYSGEVEVYSGLTDSVVTTVSLGYCPIGSWVDSRRRYAWVAAQCGAGSDPVWAINADTYEVVAGPLHTHGVMSPITPVNPVTGRLYGSNSAGTFEINPKTFALSPTSFGVVLNVDAATNLLYSQITDGLNIVAGWSEKITKTVALSYTPSFVGVNPAVNHIYTGSGQGFIEVREGNTGRLLGTINLTGATVLSVGGAEYSSRAIIYATVSSGSSFYLYQIPDNY